MKECKSQCEGVPSRVAHYRSSSTEESKTEEARPYQKQSQNLKARSRKFNFKSTGRSKKFKLQRTIT